MSQKITRWLGIALIVIGIALLIYHFIPSYVVSQNAKENETTMQEISAEDIENNQQTTGEIDFGAVDNLSADMAFEDGNAAPPEWIIGQLVIPAVEMNLPVYKTLNNQTLMSGAAIMRSDVEMGKGNFPIAGHYTHTNANLFGPLRDLEEGDVIRMTDKKKIYEYEAVKREVVPPTALEMIEDEQTKNYGGQPIISLMQCYYVNFQNTGDREFFIGKLRNIYDYDERLIFVDEFYDELPTKAAE